MIGGDILSFTLMFVGDGGTLTKLRTVSKSFCAAITPKTITKWEGIPNKSMTNLKVLDIILTDLSTFVAPEGCREINGSYSSFTSFVAPKGCKKINLSYSRLESFEAPEGCVELDVSYNLLTSLTFNKELLVIDCSNNELDQLTTPVPEGCLKFSCVGNNFDSTSVSVPKGCVNMSTPLTYYAYGRRYTVE